MIIISIIISVCIGLMICTALFKKSKSLNSPLILFLSIGLGLGLSAQIIFYTLLRFQTLSPVHILLLHMIIFLTLFWKNKYHINNPLSKCVSQLQKSWKNYIFTLFLALFFLEIAFIILQTTKLHPFGHWDAWAVWNIKTKFIIFGKERWAQLFHLHWHTQPDYPILLPLIHSWVWITSQHDLPLITKFTALLFTVSCGGLLLTSLLNVIPRGIALLAGSLLFFLPAFQFIGTSQYADVVLAYYLLASVISITYSLREKSPSWMVLSGIFLGFMSFSKNEGIVISLLLAGLTSLYIVFKYKDGYLSSLSLLKILLIGFILTSLPTIIHKVFLAPPNRDIFLNMLHQNYTYLNFNSVIHILKYFFFTLSDPRYCYLGHFMLLLFLFKPRQYFRNETLIFTSFLITYTGVLFFVYLTTVHFDLAWRVSRTLPRILINVTPALLFIHFYTQWKEN